MIAAKTSNLPEGAWISAFGGWSPEQLQERRAPTQNELDSAAPNHPVFLQWNAFFGPSVTNSKGREILQSHGLDVPPDGTLGPDAYLWGGPTPFRLAVAKGLMIAAGTDGATFAPLNPWLNVYYMVTGKMAGGNPINSEQTISPMVALRMYTINAAWHTRNDHRSGSIEAGKVADLAVLSDNPLRVNVDDLKQIRAHYDNCRRHSRLFRWNLAKM